MKIFKTLPFLFQFIFLILFFQGCTPQPPSEQGGGGSTLLSTIIMLFSIAIIITLIILPIIIVKSKAKNYVEKYTTFLDKNGKSLNLEDKKLLSTLVKNNYKIVIRLSIACIFVIFLMFITAHDKNGYQYGPPIIILITTFNFFVTSYKFKRSCPYCNGNVKLNAERCTKCTKDISNNWVGNPILEKFQK